MFLVVPESNAGQQRVARNLMLFIMNTMFPQGTGAVRLVSEEKAPSPYGNRIHDDPHGNRIRDEDSSG